MKRFLYGLAALPFLAGISLAGQPVPLSDVQMDGVVAGFDFAERNVQNLGTTWVFADLPNVGASAAVCATDGRCFIAIQGTTFPGPVAGGTVQSLQVYAQFGPRSP
jgi:hypothetical protein